MPITSNRARLGPLKQSFSRESRRFSWIKYNQGTEDQRAGAPPERSARGCHMGRILHGEADANEQKEGGTSPRPPGWIST